ncbi:hypothetical protein [Novosphingobium humi]|uniref:Uncharacterized protein n=1 Tax=Novosphingobium humi TaxID=2282397 RepID=A0ABY7TY15_9SPHN|nr:hypothetical protein [Novosphingobium humi]WCT77873.1 hypothetical protein PQ457_02550 [Novosphingobium humi]
MEKAISPVNFARYGVTPSHRLQKAVPPDVRMGKAHLYRSTIRAQSRANANFAGHFNIITLGCGAGTTCLAVYDRATGKVTIPKEPAVVDQILMDLGPGDDRVYFHPDSRLLITIGFINDDLNRAGIGYYLWGGGGFTLLRFVPIKSVCSEAP